jgi:hypothetical protein
MAEAAGCDELVMLGYRFFNEVRQRMRPGCSVVFLAETLDGPLLGRNCDLDPGFSADIQVCRTCRPVGRPATLTTTYLGMPGGAGFNEHGLGLGTASAHTAARFGGQGLPASLILHRLLHRCSDAAEAQVLAAADPFLGKPCNVIAADESGVSALLELAPGAPAFVSPRPAGRDWQACANFFLSAHVPISPETAYLQSAYARYGRVAHQLDGGILERSCAGLKRLLTEIAQPGLCIVENPAFKTAYSQVMDLRGRRMHVAPGHPGEVAWQEAAL